ncbi:MAG TPA: nucleotidyltransferase domain-containing protein [Flavobacteriaceae bacterium]|nr:nucleotidyltransferase domain-containing protein [Flavobacteriaceae bacterium]
MENLGLSKEEISGIQKVFAKYIQIEEVLLYGSRAMGNFKSTSDIDLALMGKDIDLTLQTKIEFDLDDLLMPYKIDISIYDRISNPKLLEHINRVGKKIYSRKRQVH